MNKSESITKLAAALSKAQAVMPAAQMNAVNPFLKNKYADLGSIIETAKPVLASNGLSVAQFPVGDDKIGIETILIHESGEWISGTLYMETIPEKGKSAAQVAGSIISYLRRYAYSSVLGMYAGQDTDGNQPKSKPVKKSAPKPKAQPKKEFSKSDNDLEKVYGPVTDSQGTLYKDKDISALSYSANALNKKIKATPEPTDEGELSELEELMLKRDAVHYWINQKKDA